MTGRYSVILADPPWRYDFSRSKSRAVENQYSTMTTAAICALPITELCEDDTTLFLWATAPKLREALEVMARWRFDYKTHSVWDKKRIGMGYYFRGRHEILLVGALGCPPVPAPQDRPPSVFELPRSRHSAKPPEIRQAIERMYPTVRRVDLFAREAPPGWDVWGDEAGPAPFSLVCAT